MLFRSRLCEEADAAVEDGTTLIVLSDRGISEEYAAIPSLLAVSGLHITSFVKEHVRK